MILLPSMRLITTHVPSQMTGPTFAERRVSGALGVASRVAHDPPLELHQLPANPLSGSNCFILVGSFVKNVWHQEGRSQNT